MNKETNIYKKKCSFCHKEIGEADTIVVSSDLEKDTYICSTCIETCYMSLIDCEELMNSEPKPKRKGIRKKKSSKIPVKKPAEIKAYLDEYVIGQDKAKDILSVAVYNHYKMLNSIEDKDNETEISKSNILLLGSTGSGKTMLLQTLSKFLDVPFTIVDSSSLTAAGYVGSDVETGLRALIQAADGDIAKAERGIVYFDEFDKLARKGENVSITRDVGGEGVQQALLKLIEGSIVDVPEGQRKHPYAECMQINTKNILFVCGGSFEGIEKIISNRLGENKSNIGFGSSPQKAEKIKLGDVIDNVNTDDLKKFGLIPEIIGRLPVICTLHDLTKEALVKILKEPKNSLCKQYTKLLEYDNVTLTYDDAALEAIADTAIDRNIGARGLRSIMESLLLEYMKIAPEGHIESINITADYVTGKSKEPDIVYIEDNIQTAAL